jgi:segregation and condensation protein B
MSEETKRILEALLFAAAEPMSVKELHDRMPEGADVGAALLALKDDYAGRGVNLVEMDGHWAFRTADDLAEALTMEREAEKTLSKAAMETLSIIAYHQPVTRAEIENIRGVSTNRGTLDVLIDAGWVKPGRRRESPGRPLTWLTTPAFLDQFGLESLMDLPGLDDLKASGLLDRRPAIDTLDMAGDLFGDEAEARALEKDLSEKDLSKVRQARIDEDAEDFEEDIEEEMAS